jgi:hypothetical protein
VLHSLTYSIIDHIQNTVPDVGDVVWLYDGVSLTDRAKPFVTVEQLTEESTAIATGRLDYGETYHFQIGLRATSVSERSRLSESLKQTLRQPDIPFLDTTGPTPVSAGFFVAEIDAVTPMPSDDLTNETDKHLVYFDVSIEVYRVNGNGLDYTQ